MLITSHMYLLQHLALMCHMQKDDETLQKSYVTCTASLYGQLCVQMVLHIFTTQSTSIHFWNLHQMQLFPSK